ncbi:HIT family protein [Nonomuraea cavernae]|uniref:HIT family protein n=1 Tax=Nonomuraea cavernae TaxID=2045107 RepID=A0A917Z948_9ACTN|nr:HIT family protein [Nonomuraea cavernae]MCA2189236.1 HIT family protein [Nonomuraea cavernae]GGO76636.1 HIT family protein [Nonomuraea cavernae]
MSDDPFCRIIAGERPAFVVHEDDLTVSFLDGRPVFKGHVLVVPRAHVETLSDLTEVGPFFERVQEMARAVEAGLEAGGTFVALNNRVSQSVPHLHVHVVPRNPMDGLRGFFWPRTRYASDEEARSYAATIAGALSGGAT